MCILQQGCLEINNLKKGFGNGTNVEIDFGELQNY